MNKMVDPSLADATPISTGHRPLNFKDPLGALPELRADEGNLAKANPTAWRVLKSSNRHPWLYRIDGRLAYVVRADDGHPLPEVLAPEHLQYMLSHLATWKKTTRRGLVDAYPPMQLVKSVLATPEPNVPVLAGIVNTPVFGRTGELSTDPGYHPDAQVLYAPMPGFLLAPAPERPTPKEVATARQLICEDLFGDFPFVDQADRAHAVAMLLLGFLRNMIEGPTPLHLIEKPTAGVGASLMADIVATILTGNSASMMSEALQEDEWRKRLTSALLELPNILVFDNLRHKLDSSAVAMALTSRIWGDRILGFSKMARPPIRCVWVATGINPQFSTDIARRVVSIRLDAEVERPEHRSTFRHPDLTSWVRKNRPHLVAACLTLGRAWIAADSPLGERTLRSYEEWAKVIGGVLAVAGIDGFLSNRDQTTTSSDVERDGWNNFVGLWWDRYGTEPATVQDLFELALNCEPGPPINGRDWIAQRTSLGIAIRSKRNCRFSVGDLRLQLVSAGKSHGAARWKLQVCNVASPSDTDPN